jgi:hypothetical protein
VSDRVFIPERFNGPPASGNGGYACGTVARLLGADVAQVSLRTPPPLDTALSVVRADGRVELRDGDTVVAEAEPAELALDVPAAVHPDAAEAASEAGRARWGSGHPFPTCVVCGPEREPGDGFRIFPGELPGGDGLFAGGWTPAPWLGDEAGRVRPEAVWAALDCPTSAPVMHLGGGPPAVLARLTARLGCDVRVGERHALVSWRLAVDGRKSHSASALFDESGRLLCAARALWIELREPRRA